MVTTPSFYNLKDQGIYAAGDFFIPQERYRAAPYNVNQPNNPDEVPAGIPTVYQPQGSGGGGGFNPYNPDMSQIRTDYNPNFDFRTYQDFEGRYGDSLTGMDRKQMDMYPEYYGVDTGVPKTGIAGFMDKAVNFIPGVGALKTAGKFIGGALNQFMPVNQRAIMENELRGQGVFVDDIGRIVAGPGGYNTPEGIMAGYNAAQMNEGTFDKRTDRIGQTLGEKYGLSAADIQGIADGTLTEEDIQNKYGINTNLISNLRNINIAKQNFVKTQNKAAEIAAFEKLQKEQAKIEAAAAASRAESARQYDPNIHGPNNYGLGSDGKQSFDSGQGFGINATTGGPVSNKSGKGRTDYMDGGIVDLVDIYD
jgi:hypothetical protein